MENPYRFEEAVVNKIDRNTADTKTYTLSLKDSELQNQFSFRPGQFIMISMFGVGEAPFSISSDPDDKSSFATTVRRVGNLTGVLDRCKEGDTVGVRGPYGTGWPLDKLKQKDCLIIAGGLGLPPLRSVITQISHNRSDYGQLEILYGARTPADMIFPEQYGEWRKMRNTRLLLTVDSVPAGVDWKHAVGVVTLLFDEMQTTPDNSIVLTCGPEIMMRFVVGGLIGRGFEAGEIYVSLERRMKCGIAQCGHCQIGPKYVCKDGPVFCYSNLRGLPDLTV